ncbi:MAG: hypothetical protein K6G07_03030 [Lachnospiraceae bacterium]|nr:hypothetical protein [Lachnospiraceae bacterium]
MPGPGEEQVNNQREINANPINANPINANPINEDPLNADPLNINANQYQEQDVLGILNNAGGAHLRNIRKVDHYTTKEGMAGKNETLRDIEIIDEALKGNIMQLDESQKAKLKVIQGRNRSHELVNMGTKTFGDSDLMADVKKKFVALEEILNFPCTGNMTVDFLDEVEQAYAEALAACQKYRKHKNPTFQSGIDRKKMVMENMNRISREADVIAEAKKRLIKGRLAGNPRTGATITARELLIETEYAMAMENLGRNHAARQEAEAQQPVQVQQQNAQADNATQDYLAHRREGGVHPLDMKKLNKHAQLTIRLMTGERTIENYLDDELTKKTIIHLQAILRTFKPGEAWSQYASSGDTVFRLIQTEDGTLKVRHGNEEITIPGGAVKLARNLELQVLKHSDLFTKEAVQSVAGKLRQREPKKGEGTNKDAREELLHMRKMYSDLLLKLYPNTIRKQELVNIPLHVLGEMVQLRDQEGVDTATRIKQMIQLNDNAYKSGSEEILERRMFASTGLQSDVEIVKKAGDYSETSDQRVERETANKLRALIKDLLYVEDGDLAQGLIDLKKGRKNDIEDDGADDEDDAKEPVNVQEKMVKVLRKHSEILVDIVKNNDYYKKALDAIEFPEAKEGEKSLKEEIRTLFSDLSENLYDASGFLAFNLMNTTQAKAEEFFDEYLTDETASMKSFCEKTAEIYTGKELGDHYKEMQTALLEKSSPEGWSEDETAVREMFADMIFDAGTWSNATEEGVETSPYERVKKVALKHAGALAWVLMNPTLLDSVIDKLPLGMGGDEQEIAKMKNEIKGMMANLPKGMIDARATHFMVQSVLTAKINGDDPEIFRAFTGVYDAVQKTVKNVTDTFQESIAAAVNSVFKPPAKVEEKEEQLRDANDPTLTEEEKEAVIRKGNERLAKIMEECMTGDSGQGQFIKNVLCNYFSGVSDMDKRSMIAAAFRYAKPVKADMTGMTEEQKEEYENKVKGEMLAAVLKGAGPLLQKIMQGLPEGSLPKELTSAVSDMKSKLAPMPDAFIEAEMQAIVDRSEGKISKIKVEKSLGAASVGQAFLCKLYRPGQDEPEEVVIKLLRSDVHNRMAREKEFMLRMARKTDNNPENPGEGHVPGGMELTYLGQLETIEKELDLTKEAENVDAGIVYDNPLKKLDEEKKRDKKEAKGEKVFHSIYERKVDAVKAMKVNRLVEPTESCLMLEKAPGTTLDDYVASANAEIQKILDKYKGEKMVGQKMLTYSEEDRVRLLELMEQAQKRHTRMLELSEKWVEEGVYKSGYYHGDLHSGNIMITDEQATVIDFGNVVQLTKSQQRDVSNMILAAMTKKTDLFIKSLKNLSTGTSEEDFEAKRAELEEMLTNVLTLGDENSTGLRIGAALMKAQTMGLPIPPAIYNFSQCQMRLQNSVNDTKNLIDRIAETVYSLDKKITGGSNIVISPAAEILKCPNDTAPHARMQHDQLRRIKEKRDAFFGPDEKELLENVRKTEKKDVAEFEQGDVLLKYKDIADKTIAFVNDLKAFAALSEDDRTESKFNKLKERFGKIHIAVEEVGDGDEFVDTSYVLGEISHSFMDDPEGTLVEIEEALSNLTEQKPLIEAYNALRSAQKSRRTTPEQLKSAEDAFQTAYKSVFKKLIMDKNQHLVNLGDYVTVKSKLVTESLDYAYMDEEYGPRLKELFETVQDKSSEYNDMANAHAKAKSDYKSAQKSSGNREKIKGTIDNYENLLKKFTGESKEPLSKSEGEAKQQWTVLTKSKSIKEIKEVMGKMSFERQNLVYAVLTDEQRQALYDAIDAETEKEGKAIEEQQKIVKDYTDKIKAFYDGGSLTFQKEQELKNLGYEKRKDDAELEIRRHQAEIDSWRIKREFLWKSKSLSGMREEMNKIKLVTPEELKQLDENEKRLNAEMKSLQEPIDEAKKELIPLYKKLLKKKYDRIIAAMEKKKSATTNKEAGKMADDFLDVMGKLGNRHQAETIKRLGFWEARAFYKAMK